MRYLCVRLFVRIPFPPPFFLSKEAKATAKKKLPKIQQRQQQNTRPRQALIRRQTSSIAPSLSPSLPPSLPPKNNNSIHNTLPKKKQKKTNPPTLFSHTPPLRPSMLAFASRAAAQKRGFPQPIVVLLLASPQPHCVAPVGTPSTSDLPHNPAGNQQTQHHHHHRRLPPQRPSSFPHTLASFLSPPPSLFVSPSQEGLPALRIPSHPFPRSTALSCVCRRFIRVWGVCVPGTVFALICDQTN